VLPVHLHRRRHLLLSAPLPGGFYRVEH
jgi:hypothetical protein